MKCFGERVPAYDIMATFIVQYLINEYALEVEDLWGDCAATYTNLFKHCYKVSLQQAILF